MRDDLGDVGVDAASHFGLRQPGRARMLRDRRVDHGILVQCLVRMAALLQLVAGQPRAEFVEGAEGPAAEPPVHEGAPSSRLRWA